jgi:transcriptional regulator with XRE-family HTH domain
MESHISLAQELAHCRERLQISQVRLARLMNLKTHRLSDLEKARSTPTEAEAQRVRAQLQQIMNESLTLLPALPPLRNDPLLIRLMHPRLRENRSL